MQLLDSRRSVRFLRLVWLNCPCDSISFAWFHFWLVKIPVHHWQRLYLPWEKKVAQNEYQSSYHLFLVAQNALVLHGNLTHWTGWSPLFNYLEHILSLVELYQTTPGSLDSHGFGDNHIDYSYHKIVAICYDWNKGIRSPFERLRVAQQCTSRSLLVTLWCAAGHLNHWLK